MSGCFNAFVVRRIGERGRKGRETGFTNDRSDDTLSADAEVITLRMLGNGIG